MLGIIILISSKYILVVFKTKIISEINLSFFMASFKFS